jgi:hypothetical protein
MTTLTMKDEKASRDFTKSVSRRADSSRGTTVKKLFNLSAFLSGTNTRTRSKARRAGAKLQTRLERTEITEEEIKERGRHTEQYQ